MDYFKIFTLMLGCFASYIAFQQFKLSRHKAKLELFDLRYNVYDAVRDVRGHVMGSGQVSREQLNKYVLGINDSRFLFGKDVQRYLTEITTNLINLISYNEKAKNLADVKRDEYLEKETKILIWFSDLDSKNSVFDRYMDLSKPSF